VTSGPCIWRQAGDYPAFIEPPLFGAWSATLKQRPNEPEARALQEALANAVYADCRSSCLSEASRVFVCTVIETIEGHKTRKYSRRGAKFAAFAKAAEGFLGDLLRARDHPEAAGWVFRPLRSDHFKSSGTSLDQFAALRKKLEFLGLIERAPHSSAIDRNASEAQKILSRNAAPRFRAALKLIAMARDAGVGLDALGEHFGPSLCERVPPTTNTAGAKRLTRTERP
jgi:hypothetical protein